MNLAGPLLKALGEVAENDGQKIARVAMSQLAVVRYAFRHEIVVKLITSKRVFFGKIETWSREYSDRHRREILLINLRIDSKKRLGRNYEDADSRRLWDIAEDAAAQRRYLKTLVSP